MPHRAHVLRPHRRDARDDPGGARRRTARRRWPRCCRSSATTSPAVPGDGGPAGDDPPARSAAARVPAARRQGPGGAGQGDRASRPRTIARRVEELHEFNPMLGHRGCRLGIVYPGDHRDAGAGDLRGGLRREEGRHRGPSGSHDPAGRLPAGVQEPGEDRPRHGRQGVRREGREGRRTWSAR